MQNSVYVHFLQWALPQLHMRWTGFRKVRGQVCKRIAKRLAQLDLPDVVAYRDYLTRHPQEWTILDGLCRITISRFYRDRLVFEQLSEQILPGLASRAQRKKAKIVRVWSIGCSSGEEPYTVVLLWQHLLAQRFSAVHLSIIATEIDSLLLERCKQACYPTSAIKNLPGQLRDTAFSRNVDLFCIKPAYKKSVEFVQQDIRKQMPENRFDLILCRNLVFTYFDIKLQTQILHRLYEHSQPYGWLVLGVHEKLPKTDCGFRPESERLGLYRS